MTMIRAITFDFWQTLYQDTPELNRKRQIARAERCRRFLAALGRPFTQAEVEAGFEAAYALATEMWRNHKGVAEAACIQRFLETLDLRLETPNLEHFTRFTAETMFEVPPVIIPSIKEILPRLSEKYRLGVISDTGLTPGRVLRQLMARDGILEFFSAQTFSDETTHTKPEAVQFHATLKRLDAEPAEAVHIGDLVRTDIVGAKRAGMKAIRFAGVTRDSQDDRWSDAVIEDYRDLESVLARLDGRETE
jgi:putative hydrolase of the HAD superfamily